MASTRREILAAAARCFAARGFDGATMSQIASAAGFTAASLYTYYRGKAEILEAMLEQFSAEMLETFDQSVPPSLGFEQKLELLLTSQLRLLDERRDMMLVFTTERARTSDGKERGIATYTRALERWLRRVGSKADIGNSRPGEAAFLVVGIAHAFFLRWAGSGAKTRLEKEASHVVDLFLHGVCGQRATEVEK